MPAMDPSRPSPLRGVKPQSLSWVSVLGFYDFVVGGSTGLVGDGQLRGP